MGNDQAVIQSKPTFHPQSQKGKKHTHKLINERHASKLNEQLFQTGGHSATVIQNSSNNYFTYFLPFFPRDGLDEILDLIESVSGDFPTCCFLF